VIASTPKTAPTRFSRTTIFPLSMPTLKVQPLAPFLLSLYLLAHAHTQPATRNARATLSPTAAAGTPDRLSDASASRAAQTLPIRRVILYSNGVAYVERRGTVSGHAEIDLSFKQSQVDDVLKSMVVLDLGQGG